MRFTRKDNMYRIIRLTGSQDNISDVSFDEDNKNNIEIEVIEWPIQEGEKIRTSKKEVLNQVLSGLESVNESLGTTYKLSATRSSSLSLVLYEYARSKLIEIP